MTYEITPEKRRRILLAGGIVILLAIIIILRDRLNQPSPQEAFYQEALEATEGIEKNFSPDRRRYAADLTPDFQQASQVWLVDTEAGKAYTYASFSNKIEEFFWSADSRFVMLYSSNHYGTGELTIFDMEQGNAIPTPGYDPCGMWTMSVCNYEAVAAVAPISPLIVTRDGTFIHLPDGSSYNMRPDVPGSIIQARWSISESRLFVASILIDRADAEQATLSGYFADMDGKNVVEAFSFDFDTSAEWYQSATLKYNNPPLCEWNTDETGVQCVIGVERYDFEDTRASG